MPEYYTENEYLCYGSGKYLSCDKLYWTSDNEFHIVGKAMKYTRIK